MRTIFRRRTQGLVLAALTLVLGLTERAQAQQTGLFPLAPIRRQRVPCDQQDPTYKIHKYQYFGYHPTCWKPFPAGWGCPSPEAPNKAESFRKFPLLNNQNQPNAEAPGAMENQPDLTQPEMPTLPGGIRSPFETQPDTGRPDTGRPDAAPVTPPRPREGVNPSPFELDRKDTAPGAVPATPPGGPRASRSRPAAAPSEALGPEISAPTAATGPISSNRGNRVSNNEEIGAQEEGGPLLALPNAISIPRFDDSSSNFPEQSNQPPAMNPDAAANPGNPTGSSAPRRGFLSGLFNNLGISWSRR